MKTADIVTSQFVNLSQTPAGVGERLLARIIDVVVIAVYAWGVTILISELRISFYGLGTFWEITLGIIPFLPVIFYSLLCELFLDGQTIGKKAMKTRVVMVDGSSPTIGAILLRWVCILVDIHMLCIGIVFIICTRRNQRLGDLAAGTMVIRLPNKKQMHLSLDEFYYASPDYIPVYPEVQHLSLGQIDVVRRMLYDQAVYTDEQVGRLSRKIETLLDIRRHEQDDTDFLKTILYDYQYYALQLV